MGNVKSGFGECLSWGTYSVRDISCRASGCYISEVGVRKECKLRGVSDHLVETILLLGSKSKLVPDVHPVTVLAVDALTSNLNLNHGDELVSGVIEPTCIYISFRVRSNL